jgi:hypothetical protein
LFQKKKKEKKKRKLFTTPLFTNFTNSAKIQKKVEFNLKIIWIFELREVRELKKEKGYFSEVSRSIGVSLRSFVISKLRIWKKGVQLFAYPE